MFHHDNDKDIILQALNIMGLTRSIDLFGKLINHGMTRKKVKNLLRCMEKGGLIKAEVFPLASGDLLDDKNRRRKQMLSDIFYSLPL